MIRQVDTTAILSFLFQQMEALSKGEIDTNKANAQANLAKQACNVLNYELKRTEVQMKMFKIGGDIKAEQIELREIETKQIEPSTSELEQFRLEETIESFLERNKAKIKYPKKHASLFRALGIQTIGELLCFNERDLLRAPSYGMSSLLELSLALKDEGLFFKK